MKTSFILKQNKTKMRKEEKSIGFFFRNAMDDKKRKINL